MGTIDEANAKRKIKIIDLTGFTIAQIEDAFNNNYGSQGWRIVQIVQLGNKNYLLAERLVQ